MNGCLGFVSLLSCLCGIFLNLLRIFDNFHMRQFLRCITISSPFIYSYLYFILLYFILFTFYFISFIFLQFFSTRSIYFILFYLSFIYFFFCHSSSSTASNIILATLSRQIISIPRVAHFYLLTTNTQYLKFLYSNLANAKKRKNTKIQNNTYFFL